MTRVQALRAIKIAGQHRAAGAVFELDEDDVDIEELVEKGDLALHPGEPFVQSAVPPAGAYPSGVAPEGEEPEVDTRPSFEQGTPATPGEAARTTSELASETEEGSKSGRKRASKRGVKTPAKTAAKSTSKTVTKTATKRAAKAPSTAKTATTRVSRGVTRSTPIEHSTPAES